MSYLAKGKRQDVILLAEELGITIEGTFDRIKIRDAVIKSEWYDEEFTRELFENIINDRLEKEIREREMCFELEKLKLKTYSAISEVQRRNALPNAKDDPEISITGRKGMGCADTGASHTTASKELCNPVKEDREEEHMEDETQSSESLLIDFPRISCLGEGEEGALETSKQHLMIPPPLIQSDTTKPYLMEPLGTDASYFASSAVLLQGIGSNEHPVEYASQLLTSAERNYSTRERVTAMSQSSAMSDHQLLKWLMNLKPPPVLIQVPDVQPAFRGRLNRRLRGRM